MTARARFAFLSFVLIAAILSLPLLIAEPRFGLVFLGLLAYGAYRSKDFRIVLKNLANVLLALIALLIVLAFPYDHDGPESLAASAKLQAAYASDSAPKVMNAELQENFLADQKINAGRVADFVRTYNLADKRALDIGSGTGYLQDIVQDYTGVDIQPGLASYYHKPYVLGSVTQLPFADSSFDVAWSIYVLEHVPNPEKGLTEIRRVLRDRALLYFHPAWNVSPLASEGYSVRPYSDFGPLGKLKKASIPFRETYLAAFMSTYPVRMARGAWINTVGSPSRLRYTLLEPNTLKYWQADSDAVNSFDRFEVMQWFVSRGDECMNCGDSSFWELWQPLILRINKMNRKPISPTGCLFVPALLELLQELRVPENV
jgi:SAM-dependent methyltransferase